LGRRAAIGAEVSTVIPEADIWRAAVVMMKRYKGDAMVEAAARADRLLEDGDWRAAVTWHRIFDAIGRLQAKTPGGGETVH
jgi:hypothetical protein